MIGVVFPWTQLVPPNNQSVTGFGRALYTPLSSPHGVIKDHWGGVEERGEVSGWNNATDEVITGCQTGAFQKAVVFMKNDWRDLFP